MFKNREIRIRVAKLDPNPNNEEAAKPFMTQEDAKALLHDTIKATAIAFVALTVVSVVAHTAGELVIRAVESNIE